MAHMKKKFWHVSSGQLYTGGDETDAVAYKDHLRKAYGSLRNIQIYEALSEDADPDLLLYDTEPGNPETKARIAAQWRRI